MLKADSDRVCIARCAFEFLKLRVPGHTGGELLFLLLPALLDISRKTQERFLERFRLFYVRDSIDDRDIDRRQPQFRCVIENIHWASKCLQRRPKGVEVFEGHHARRNIQGKTQRLWTNIQLCEFA